MAKAAKKKAERLSAQDNSRELRIKIKDGDDEGRRQISDLTFGLQGRTKVTRQEKESHS